MTFRVVFLTPHARPTISIVNGDWDSQSRLIVIILKPDYKCVNRYIITVTLTARHFALRLGSLSALRQAGQRPRQEQPADTRFD